MRIGHGYDVHRKVEGRPLILGGIKIEGNKGLLGHSDADVLLHAIMDAMLGAAALGDIGTHFPDTDEKYRGADSTKLLSDVLKLIENEGEVVGATEIQQLLKKLGKVFKLAINMQSQNLLGSFLKLLYQHMLIVFRHVQIQHILLCLHLHEQSRFTNSSSAHQHRKE